MRFWLLILIVFISTVRSNEIGEISELKGIGEITRQDSTESFAAQLASDIFSFDDVRTGNGRLAIEFLDSTIINIMEHSKVIIDTYVYDPDPSKSEMALSVSLGTFRFISGKLNKIKKENVRVKTHAASIGIRGTDFTLTVDELGRTLVILLPNADGTSSGEITVETWAGVEILNKPFQATMVST